jgi:hypothetical protein
MYLCLAEVACDGTGLLHQQAARVMHAISGEGAHRQERVRVVREVLAAATLAGGEPEAGIMAATANFAGLDVLLRAHVTYHASFLFL